MVPAQSAAVCRPWLFENPSERESHLMGGSLGGWPGSSVLEKNSFGFLTIRVSTGSVNTYCHYFTWISFIPLLSSVYNIPSGSRRILDSLSSKYCV